MADSRRRGRLDPELEAAADDGEDVLGDETPAQVDLMPPEPVAPSETPPPLMPQGPEEPAATESGYWAFDAAMPPVAAGHLVAEMPGVPLSVPPMVALAIEALVTALRTDRRFRQQVRMAAGRLQGHANKGPLTALVDAVVGSA